MIRFGAPVLAAGFALVASGCAGGSSCWCSTNGSSAHNVDYAKVAAVAKLYPNFTLEQHRAVMAEIRSQRHRANTPLSLTEQIKRTANVVLRTSALRAAAAESSTPVSAPFVGNSTFLTNPNGNFIALQRQANCSLLLYYGTSKPAQISQTIANYEQTLHAEAQLATAVDLFPNGCVDPTSGFSNRMGVYLGKTAQGQDLGAGTDASNPSLNGDGLYVGQLYSGTFDPAKLTGQGSSPDYSVPIAALTSGDLNGDGIADVVGIGAAGSIDVWIANANGTLSTHTAYAVPGDTTEAAVVADVNGDGKLDVIVATLDSSTNQEMISVLTGNGDGTLNAAQSVAVATPGHFVIQYIVAADIRSNGRNDLIASNGTVLLNNGSGTFTAGTPAFTPAAGQVVGFGGNLAVADFNKDGKADLAVDDGQEISIYLGHGDGTFTLKTSYVSDTDVGYLTATDLDGDGNIDLYVGTANSGLFGGDEDDEAQAYALMGNGDGTFQGAPVAPFVYTGTNLVPLTAGGVLDAVAQGVDAQGQYTSTFFSYLGDGKGNFTAKTALNPPSGEQFNAYAVGDVTGDGKADLVLVGVNSNTDPSSAGIYVATGDGQGDFATPTYAQVSFDAGNDTAGLTNLQLIDVNHDGKLDAVYMYSYDDLATGINYVGIAAQLGNGDGTFQAPKTLLLYSGTAGSTTTYTLLTSADMNGDGFPDLILMTSTPVANQSPQISYNLALGNGDGTFKAPAPIVTNDVNFAYTTPLAIADMNGDGIPDVVTIGRATAGDFQIAIALGNGNGTFKAANKTNFSVGGESMVAADFNGDGKVDVAILGVFGSEDSGIVFGNGDGTLAPIVTSAGNVFNQALNLQMDLGLSVVADFNGDGKPDILSGTTILLNQPAAAATPTFTLSASSAAASVAPGQSATTTLTLTPSGGFDASVALTCSGLPAGAVCTFSPATVSVNGSAVTDTLTISTSAATANVLTPWTTGGMMLAGILLPFAVQRRARSLPLESSQASMAHITWLLLGALLLASCHSGGGSGGTSSGGSSSGGSSSSGSSSGGSSSGGGSSGGSGGTIAGTYHVTITATAGSMTHTLAYTLTVS